MLKKLTKRLFELHYQNNQCHLSSSLSLLEPLWELYNQYITITVKQEYNLEIIEKSAKLKNLNIVLSYAHAAYAWYVILEYLGLWQIPYPAPIHPPKSLIGYTAGSLGHGLPIALGMALANPNKDVHCFVSDGETAEGSIYESLNMMNFLKMDNFKLHIIYNEASGNREFHSNRFYHFGINTTIHNMTRIYQDYPFLKPIDAHYYKLTAEDIEWVERYLSD